MNDIELSLQEMLFNGELQRLSEYDRYDNYYTGCHSTHFPTGFIESVASQYKIKANYCAAIIDEPVSKLKIRSFSCDDENADKLLKKVWKYNRMDAKTIKIHRQTILKGDCFIQVWPEIVNNKVKYKIDFIKPEHIFAFYSSDNDDSLEYVVRRWVGFVNSKATAFKYVYYSDRIERYYSDSSVTAGMAQSLLYSIYDNDWLPYNPDGMGAIIENPYGVIPVIHFKNKPLDCPYGNSELTDAISIQDSINDLLLDLMRVAKFQAFKQRYVTGLNLDDIDFINPETGKKGLNTSASSLWYLPEGVVAGEFKSENLDGILNAIDKMVKHLENVTRTPNLSNDSKGTASSGFALAKLEAPLISKCEELQINFGNSYEDINTLLLIMAQYHNDLSFTEIPTTELNWQDLKESSPSDSYQEAQRLQILKQNNVISAAELARLLGYTPDQIQAIQIEIAQENESSMASTLGHSFGGG